MRATCTARDSATRNRTIAEWYRLTRRLHPGLRAIDALAFARWDAAHEHRSSTPGQGHP
jgi:hypothetical protein